MDNRSIPDRFLGYLYTANYTLADPDLNDLEQWAAQGKIDKDTFWKAYDSLCLTEAIKYRRTLRSVRLTPKGTLLAEKCGTVSPETIAQCRDVRKRLLFAMAEHYEEMGTPMPLRKALDRSRVTDQEFFRTLPLLQEMGYCDWEPTRQHVVVCAAVLQKVRIQRAA